MEKLHYIPTWINDDLAMFRDMTEKFLTAELAPNIEKYCEQGHVDKEFWKKAGDVGFLGASVPEEYGGSGGDHSYDLIICFEQSRLGDTGWGFSVHNFVTHYIINYGTDVQKERWLPKLVSGEKIGALAMSEPGAGSDLKAIRTSAVRDGNDFLINGSKTFISNGQIADLIVIVAKTNPEMGHKGVSLIILDDTESEGFRRGRNLKKLGLHAQDTSELFFDDLRIPAENLLGEVEGQGFYQLMRELAYERVMIGQRVPAVCEYAFNETLQYVKERKAFGNKVIDFQNTRFKLAECRSKLEALRAFTDYSIAKLIKGDLSPTEAAMFKLWASEVQADIMDECLQLHGGYGYMMEYPIAKLYADSRVNRIYGGSSEIMKEIISREFSK